MWQSGPWLRRCPTARGNRKFADDPPPDRLPAHRVLEQLRTGASLMATWPLRCMPAGSGCRGCGVLVLTRQTSPAETRLLVEARLQPGHEPERQVREPDSSAWPSPRRCAGHQPHPRRHGAQMRQQLRHEHRWLESAMQMETCAWRWPGRTPGRAGELAQRLQHLARGHDQRVARGVGCMPGGCARTGYRRADCALAQPDADGGLLLSQCSAARVTLRCCRSGEHPQHRTSIRSSSSSGRAVPSLRY